MECYVMLCYITHRTIFQKKNTSKVQTITFGYYVYHTPD